MPLTDAIKNYHIPRWNELPDLDLYMDQVIGVVEKIMLPLSDEREAKIITATMVNNYVKQKLVSPPVNKKYGRSQLSSLIMICVLKRLLSLAEIAQVLGMLLPDRSGNEAYDLFCDVLEEELKLVFFGERSGESAFADDTLLVLHALSRTYADLLRARYVLASALNARSAIAQEEKERRKIEKKEKKQKKKEQDTLPGQE